MNLTNYENNLSVQSKDRQTCGTMVLLRLFPKAVNVNTTPSALYEATA